MTYQENTAKVAYRRVRLMDPKSDVVFKKIFGEHPHLVKSFLNGILPLPDDRLIETIEYLPSEQTPRIPVLKNSIVDVKCTDQHGRIFIVEVQMQWHPNFDRRLLFGASNAYVKQLKGGHQYSKLCPVYGLALINDTYDSSDEWYHRYQFKHMTQENKVLEGMELIFVELPKIKIESKDHRRMGILWLRFLNEMDRGPIEIPQDFQDNPDLALAVELAQESAYTPAELDSYDRFLDAIRVDAMFEELAIAKEEALKAEAIEIGKAKGIEIGKAEGVEIGKAEGVEIGKAEGVEIGKADGKIEGRIEGEDKKARSVARNLLKKGLSLEDIADVTDLNIDFIRQLSTSDN